MEIVWVYKSVFKVISDPLLRLGVSLLKVKWKMSSTMHGGTVFQLTFVIMRPALGA